MSQWSRTSLVFAPSEMVENAVTYVAGANSMKKIDFIPGLISKESRDLLWYSDFRSSDLWIVALRSTRMGYCILKTIPLALMSECGAPIWTRPMIASICALLSCHGVCSIVEDSSHLFVASDESGSCQITGLTLSECDDVVWPFQEDLAAQLGLDNINGHATDGQRALQAIEFEPTHISSNTATSVFVDAGGALDTDLSDGIMYKLIDGEGASIAPGWIVCAFEKVGSDRQD